MLPVFGTDDPEKFQRHRAVYAIAQISSFSPKDYTYRTLINSGDLKLINDFELKSRIEEHYSGYEDILKAYERRETINKDYLGHYFIYHTDFDLMKKGQSPFKEEKLLKNILQSTLGSLMIKQQATQNGMTSCDSILNILK